MPKKAMYLDHSSAPSSSRGRELQTQEKNHSGTFENPTRAGMKLNSSMDDLNPALNMRHKSEELC